MNKNEINIEDIIAEFEFLDSEAEIISLIIDYANKFNQSNNQKLDGFIKIEYCESEVYTKVYKKKNFYNIEFIVLSKQGVSAKALCYIITECFNFSDELKLKKLNVEIIDKIFGNSLSFTKRRGLENIVKTVKLLAEKEK